MNEDTAPIPLEDLHAQRDWVRRVARAVAAGEADAEDLEQEVWLRTLESRPRGIRSIRAWLGTVIRHAATDLRRATRRRTAREAAVAIPETAEGPAAADVVARTEALAKVVEALLRLREPYRTTLLLRYQEDLAPAEIARRLGLPRETVKTRLRRGLEEMRELLGPQDGEKRKGWMAVVLPLLPRHAAVPAGIAGHGAWSGADRATRIATETFREITLMNLKILGAATLSLALVAGALWWASSAATPTYVPGDGPTPSVASSGRATDDPARWDVKPIPSVSETVAVLRDRLPNEKEWEEAAKGSEKWQAMVKENADLRKEVEEFRKQAADAGLAKSAKPLVSTESLSAVAVADLLQRLKTIARTPSYERKGAPDVEGGLKIVDELLSRGLEPQDRATVLVDKAILHRFAPSDPAKEEAALREAAGLQGMDTEPGREAVQQLAWTHARKGDDREAATLFDRVASEPSTPPGQRATARWEAATRADRLGERESARRSYQAFLDENASQTGKWFVDCCAKAKERLKDL